MLLRSAVVRVFGRAARGGRARPRRRRVLASAVSHSRLQAAGDQPVARVDRPVAALGPVGVVAGLLDLAPPLRQRGVVAVLELLGGVPGGLHAGGVSAARNAPATAASIRAPPTRMYQLPRPSTRLPAGAVVAGPSLPRRPS